jgi:hypothetical protein
LSCPVNRCWLSPAKLFLVSSLIGNHNYIFVLSRLRTFGNGGLLFDGRICLDYYRWFSLYWGLAIPQSLNLSHFHCLFIPSIKYTDTGHVKSKYILIYAINIQKHHNKTYKYAPKHNTNQAQFKQLYTMTDSILLEIWEVIVRLWWWWLLLFI